jgi:hypothetical protein
MAWTKAKTAIGIVVAVVLATSTTTFVVKKAVTAKLDASYETVFRHPNSSSMDRLEQLPPLLIVRPTRYPNVGSGIWDSHGKGACVGATLAELFAWAYGDDPTRVILPEDAPQGNFDYLATLPDHQNDALRDELKRQFGLLAVREVRPTDVLLLTTSDAGKLNSFRTKGGPFADYGTGMGNIQIRHFTNAPLSCLAGQEVEGCLNNPALIKLIQT